MKIKFIEVKTKQPFPNINREYAMVGQDIEKYLYADTEVVVDICVLAYNQLEERTKICIEHILRYSERHKFHLILLDNGSTDGTLAFFEAVPYENKTIIHFEQNISPTYAENAALSVLKGKYLVRMSNDVVVMPNWLDHLLVAMEAEPSYGLVFPCSTSSGCLQTPVSADYSSIEKLATVYNAHSDPLKWEERMVALSSLCMVRRVCLDQCGGLWDPALMAYADMDFSVRIRRNGYKIVICKDTIIHSETPEMRGIDAQECTSVKNFKLKYPEIHPWHDYANSEPMLVAMLPQPTQADRHNLLGVDVKAGTALLEMKNKFHAYGCRESWLWAFTTQPQYYVELQTICPKKVFCDRMEYLYNRFEGQIFDGIILGEAINYYPKPIKLLQDLVELLETGGVLLFKLKNFGDVNYLATQYGAQSNVTPKQENLTPMAVESVLNCLELMEIDSVQIETLNVASADDLEKRIRTALKKSKLTSNIQNVMEKINVSEYLFCAQKR